MTLAMLFAAATDGHAGPDPAPDPAPAALPSEDDKPVIRRSETDGPFDTPEQRKIERGADQLEAERRRRQAEEHRRQQEFEDFLNDRQLGPDDRLVP